MALYLINSKGIITALKHVHRDNLISYIALLTDWSRTAEGKALSWRERR